MYSVTIPLRRAAGLALAAFIANPAISFARTCEVAVHLDDNVTLGAIQLTIGYGVASGSWRRTPTGLDCSGDVPSTLVPFLDVPELSQINVSFISLSGIRGPRKIAHCWFVEDELPALPEFFELEVQEATKLDGKVVYVDFHLAVTCVEPTTTTTSTTSTTSTSSTTTSTTQSTTSSTTTTSTSTTSTTLVGCGNGVVEDDEECDDGNQASGDGCDEDCSSDVLCGDANGNHRLQTSDALIVLRNAIGQSVSCPAYVCDADGDDTVRASDSLRILKRAVGQSVVMACPAA